MEKFYAVVLSITIIKANHAFPADFQHKLSSAPPFYRESPGFWSLEWPYPLPQGFRVNAFSESFVLALYLFIQ